MCIRDSRISGAKAKLWDPRELARHADSFRDEVVVKVYEAYQKLLDSNGALDFDDLLMRVAIALRDEPAFRDRWQQRFHFVLIDEYQDTNHAQYLIARSLAELRRNICATGDADQSIYGWRGADIENILGFTKDYPDARVVKLEQNFRSTKTICRGAASVIERNAMRHDRSIWTENEEGSPIRFRLATDADDEAAVALAEIRRAREAGRQWGDVAIFYRTNAQSRCFEEALVQASVPYRIVGAVAFYNRQEIKDLVAYLRVCVNTRDGLALARIINRPTRGIGQTTIARMRAWAAEHEASLWQAVARVEEIDTLGGRARNAIVAFRDLIDGFRSAMDGPVAELCERVAYRVFDWAEKSGLNASRAFEPGSGASRWPLENQRLIFANVRADEIGVSLTSHLLMRPRKTVSFLIGAGTEIEQASTPFSCQGCRRTDCPYRYNAK